MSVTDPIADLLTRIRNANQMRYNEVVIPSSNMKLEIVKILKNEGFIADYKIEKNEVQDNIIVTLKTLFSSKLFDNFLFKINFSVI